MPNQPPFIRRPVSPLGQFNREELESGATLTPRERDLFRELINMNRLLFVLALGQGAAGGKFEKPVQGDEIQAMVSGTDAGFISVYKNPNPYPVAVTILGQFSGVPGKQVKISLSQAQASNEVIDYLGNTAAAPSFNKRISVPIILAPKQEIFIASADTGFALLAADIFAVRVLDIRRLVADAAWETA